MVNSFLKLKAWISKLRANRMRFLLFIFISIIIGISTGIGLVNISQPNWSTTTISSSGIIRFSPHLTIQVSPPGYPIVGGSWEINVFTCFAISDSGSPVYKPSSNATVLVSYFTENGKTKEYNLSVDENGKTKFTFVQEISGIAFQAFSQGFSPSNIVALSGKYVPFNEVDNLFAFGIITVLGSLVGSGWLIKKEKLWRWQKIFLIFFVVLFSIVTLFSTYSKLFRGTIWGYPDNIVGNIITFTRLKMLYFSGLAFLLLVVIIFIFLYKPPNQKTEGSFNKENKISSKKTKEEKV